MEGKGEEPRGGGGDLRFVGEQERLAAGRDDSGEQFHQPGGEIRRGNGGEMRRGSRAL